MMNLDSNRPKTVRRLCCFLLACLLAAGLLTACELADATGFPLLETSVTGDSSTTQASVTQPNGTSSDRLKVALPCGRDTLEAVRLLYLAKKSGLLNQEPGQYIGQQIDLEDLLQFDDKMAIDLVTVSATTGATAEEVSIWRAAGTMPDIVYCLSAASTIGLAKTLDLNNLLYDNQLLSAGHVYSPALENCRAGQVLYGIPYLASTPVIYINQALLTQLGLVIPAKNWTWPDWLAFAAQAQQAIDAAGLGATPAILAGLKDNPEKLNAQLAKSVFVMDNPADLLAWLPASFNKNAGWAMWNGGGLQFGQTAFLDATHWLQGFSGAGNSMLHLDAAQRLTALGALDAVQSGRVLLWPGDSADLGVWRQTGLTVNVCLMPSGMPPKGGENSTNAANLPATGNIPIKVRSLIVSQSCINPALASDFAAFFALDADALLMQSRYQVFEGLLPLVRDAVVWNAIVGPQAQRSQLLSLMDKLPDAYYSGQQLQAGWDKAIKASLGMYGPQILLATRQQEKTLLDKMIQAGKNALQEE
jgi:ABC-type glycerol-3-phosphate transport system substrate-binding protein